MSTLPIDFILQAPENARRKLIDDLIKKHLGNILGLKETDIKDDSGFVALGLDSISAVNLCKNLQADLGDYVTLGSTTAFTYPSVLDLSLFIEKNISDITIKTVEKKGQKASISKNPLINQLLKSSQNEKIQLIRERIRQHIQEIIGISNTELNDDRGFVDLGLDSIGATQLCKKLKSDFSDHLPISSENALTFRSINELTLFIAGFISGVESQLETKSKKRYRF